MPTQQLPNQLYTAKDAAMIDRHVIEQVGVPGYRLMLRAAQAAFELLRFKLPKAQSLVVVAGGGNNAGDGYALATIAHRAGWQVQVIALVTPDSLKNEASQAVADCVKAGVRCVGFNDIAVLPDADVYVDALFGIGLCRAISSGPFAEAIQWLNATPKPVLALDTPSGLSVDTGHPLGLVVQADLTITFIVVKRGLLTGQGPDVTGELWFDDLGVSETLAAELCQGVRYLTLSTVPLLPRRLKSAHKGSFGDVLIVGGDVGMAGAAVLATEAAISGGAGRVTLVTQPEHLTAALMRCPEALSAAITDVDTAATQLAPLLQKAKVIVLGPGLGVGAWGVALARAVLAQASMRHDVLLVLDADALNLIASGALEWPKSLGQRTIMTPHPREAGRLFSAVKRADGLGGDEVDVGTVQADRFSMAQYLADGFGAHLILKGVGTVIAGACEKAETGTLESAPDHTVAQQGVCALGNPGMAVAGMGDVLSGLLGALLAQGLKPSDAAALGAVVHAAAGDLLWAQRRCASVRPTAMMEAIAHVLGELRASYAER